MSSTVFNPNEVNFLEEPMFLGQGLNVSRHDKARYPEFQGFYYKQQKQRWSPGEIRLADDQQDFSNLNDAERHVFLSNLQYQSLLDSVQGRAPVLAFGNVVSLPELETWVVDWTASEVVHNISYEHIVRSVVNDPSLVFDNIVNNEAIQARTRDIARYYDEAITLGRLYSVGGYGTYHLPDGEIIEVTERKLMKSLYMCLHAVNALEAVRFYVSFVCTWAFGERGIMSGVSEIVKLIARDEALHLAATQKMINYIRNGKEGPLWKEIAEECHMESYDLFVAVAMQEMDWAEYLFKDGSLIGLNKDVLVQYIKFITNIRMRDVGFDEPFPEVQTNPLPWVNAWTGAVSVQTAPQELELSDYLHNVDANVDAGELAALLNEQ